MPLGYQMGTGSPDSSSDSAPSVMLDQMVRYASTQWDSADRLATKAAAILTFDGSVLVANVTLLSGSSLIDVLTRGAGSAIKRKLGESLLSKNPLARFNETLARLLAYNIGVIVHEIHEHGIDPASIGLHPSGPTPPAAPIPIDASGPALAHQPHVACDSISPCMTEFEGGLE